MILLFARGFVIVALQALSVLMVAERSTLGAFLVSGTISGIWWLNTRSANREDGWQAGAAYSLGAACGSALVVWGVG